MTRLIFTVALLSLIVYLTRRMFAQPLPRSPEPQRGRSRPAPRGAPRALVCGHCSTQFEPSKDGWTCPACGK